MNISRSNRFLLILFCCLTLSNASINAGWFSWVPTSWLPNKSNKYVWCAVGAVVAAAGCKYLTTPCGTEDKYLSGHQRRYYYPFWEGKWFEVHDALPAPTIGPVVPTPKDAVKKEKDTSDDVREESLKILTPGQRENLWNALIKAAGKGNADTVQELLKWINPRYLHVDGRPLVAAALNGHQEVIESLIKANANVKATPRVIWGESQRDFPYNALNAASRAGHANVVDFLLRNKADPSVFENSALAEAIDGRHIGVVNLLLQHKVDINCKMKHGLTPLEWVNFCQQYNIQSEEDRKKYEVIKAMLKLRAAQTDTVAPQRQSGGAASAVTDGFALAWA